MNERISHMKRLEIANVCYGYVAGSFAMFTNPRARGPNFSWEWFIDWCEKSAKDWMFLHPVKGHKESINSTATQMAREIAEQLVSRMSE
jgi:hypothetical protein